jgi:hypothetical protein
VPSLQGAFRLSGSCVRRKLIQFERDGHGQLQCVDRQVIIAVARCADCGARSRVLPSNVLPRKVYGLSVIEQLATRYVAGDGSLRGVAWSLLGDRTPQHTTLHAWTEGLGAHALGRDRTSTEPHSAMVAETTARWPQVASVAVPSIDPRRFRSEPRHERLAAVARLVQQAGAVPGLDVAAPLTDWRRLAIGLGVSSPLSFRTGRSCTPIGQVVQRPPRSCGPCPRNPSRILPSRTRSPPGASSRSRPTSPPPDTRSDGA